MAELVKFMTDEGLWFAPAAPGDESAYLALYHALAAFDAGMTRPTVESPVGRKFATPVSFVIDIAATSARTVAKDVHCSPYGSMKVRRQVASAEARE